VLGLFDLDYLKPPKPPKLFLRTLKPAVWTRHGTCSMRSRRHAQANRWSEAKALLACAEHSLSVPGFLNPQDLASEASRIAEADGMNELIDKGAQFRKKYRTWGDRRPARHRADAGRGCHPYLPGCFCE
jgi:hypothetical protein